MKRIIHTIIAFIFLICSIECKNERIEVVDEPSIGVITIDATQITYGAATLKGKLILPDNLADDFEYGIEISTDKYLMTNKYRMNAGEYDDIFYFSVDCSTLSSNTSYYYRSYMINNKIVYVGEIKSFCTKELVSTGEIDSLSNVWSILNVNKEQIDGDSILFGVCYTKSVDGNSELNYMNGAVITTQDVDSLNGFSVTLKNVVFSNFYYRSFVYVDGIIHYGQINSMAGNELLTGDYYNCYVSFGTLYNCKDIRESGICYSNHEHPCINDNVSKDGFLNLPYGKTYYRTYAKLLNNDQLLYGPEKCYEKKLIEPEAVDLGLSVNWASWNIGASSPEEYGDYYAWGETEIKNSFTLSNYKFYNGNDNYGYPTYSKYFSKSTNSNINLDDDVANLLLGKEWRIPTQGEFLELMSNCTLTYMVRDEIDGYLVTSRKPGYEGVSIFMPYTYYVEGEKLNTTYYSCFCYSSSTSYYDEGFFVLRSSNDNPPSLLSCKRYYGYPIRPVCESKEWLSSCSITDTINEITLIPGLSYQFHPDAKQNDEDVSYQLTWTCSDSAVVYGYGGRIWALSPGSAIVTASIKSIKKQYKVIVLEETEIKHEYVDLGLSVKWATVNVGSLTPEGCGGYYSWGETDSKQNYVINSYKWYNSSITNNVVITKYGSDGSHGTSDNFTCLELADDVAHVKWGGNWRIPTIEEINELRIKCTWLWTSINDVEGVLVKSNQPGYEGRSIFLPAAGHCYDMGHTNSGGNLYWSSTVSTDNKYKACGLHFYSNGENNAQVFWTHADRYLGIPIRPVCP